MKQKVIEQPLPFTRPLVAQTGRFVVLVRTDRQPDGQPGHHEVSDKTFETYAQARFHADGCSASRQPVVAMIVDQPADAPCECEWCQHGPPRCECDPCPIHPHPVK